MRKNSEHKEYEIVLKAFILVDEYGMYKTQGLQSRVGSDERLNESENDALLVALCIDVLERLTGLEVGDVLKHLHTIENL